MIMPLRITYPPIHAAAVRTTFQAFRFTLLTNECKKPVYSIKRNKTPQLCVVVFLSRSEENIREDLL